MVRWQVLSQFPMITVTVALGLWLFGAPPGETVWQAVFIGLVFVWATGPVWGEPVRNWGRFRVHLERGGPWCRHEHWSDWYPLGDGSGGDSCWCSSCGWRMCRWQSRAESGKRPVPWRYRAGLPRGCGPEVDGAL
jgi:hypothetical protein